MMVLESYLALYSGSEEEALGQYLDYKLETSVSDLETIKIKSFLKNLSMLDTLISVYHSEHIAGDKVYKFQAFVHQVSENVYTVYRLEP